MVTLSEVIESKAPVSDVLVQKDELVAPMWAEELGERK